MNKKKEIVPKFRFPKYVNSEQWISTELSSLLDYERPDLYIVESDNYKNEGIPVLTANKSFILGYTDEKNNIYSRVPVIIFDDFTTEKKYVDFPFKVKSSAIKILKPKGNNVLKFVFELMNTINFEAKEHKRYYISTYQKLFVCVPKDVKEQQKIADCLFSIDDLIDAESRKLKVLEKYKKGLMQKLFPAEGQTLPEWRFPEFSDGDGWIKTSLSQICIMQAGKFINASEISDEQKNNMYPCYGGNGLRGYTLTHNCSGKYPLIGRQGALCGNVTFATGNFYATEHAIVVTANKNIDEKWLYYLLDYLQLNQYATGQAQPGLSVQTLEKVMAIYPGEGEEQKKIANCLSEIDTIIAEQSNKVEQLKAHKKGLMQGLFPSLEEADV